jgi:hypothetical protein
MNAAFAIVAIVGATDTSKTEEIAGIVFYAFLGLAAAVTVGLFIYDRARVHHRTNMSLPFLETLPDGLGRCVLDRFHRCQQGVAGCCKATCTCCTCGKVEMDIPVTVSPTDWQSISDLENDKTTIEDSMQLPLSRFKKSMGKIIDAVQGYVNLKTFNLAAWNFLVIVIAETFTTFWYFPAAFGRNVERLELTC